MKKSTKKTIPPQTDNSVRLRGVSEKIVFAVFMERLDSFITLWRENRTNSDVTFNEFLLGAADTNVADGISKKNMTLLKKLNNVVFKLELLWRRTGTDKPFEEYLEEIRTRYEEKKKSKKEVKKEK